MGYEFLLRPVEIPLAVLEGGILLAFLEHPAHLNAGDADFLADTGDDHDQSLLHQLIAGGGRGEDPFEYLAVVIGVVYFDCHFCMVLLVLPTVEFRADLIHARFPGTFLGMLFC